MLCGQCLDGEREERERQPVIFLPLLLGMVICANVCTHTPFGVFCPSVWLADWFGLVYVFGVRWCILVPLEVFKNRSLLSWPQTHNPAAALLYKTEIVLNYNT